jgi:hypothetical protein
VAVTKNQPSWRVSTCPEWCARDHDKADVDGDRDHLSKVTYSPVIRLLRASEDRGPSRREAVAADTVLGVFQGPDEPHPWISIGFSEEGEHLELSIDSARRLASDLGMLLEQLGP